MPSPAELVGQISATPAEGDHAGVPKCPGLLGLHRHAVEGHPGGEFAVIMDADLACAEGLAAGLQFGRQSSLGPVDVDLLDAIKGGIEGIARPHRREETHARRCRGP